MTSHAELLALNAERERKDRIDLFTAAALAGLLARGFDLADERLPRLAREIGERQEAERKKEP